MVVAAVAENREPFVTEVKWLFHSLRKNGGRLSDTKAMVYFVNDFPENLSFFINHNIELKVVTPLEPKSPHCNKIHMLLDDHSDCDWLVALDTDIVILGDFSDYLTGSSFCAKIVDDNPLSDEVWETFFGYFGLPAPKERFLSHFYAKESLPYFNSGVLLIPQKDIQILGTTWKNLIPKVLNIYEVNPDIARHSFYTDQFALAIALAINGMEYETLPLELNFPTHFPVHPEFIKEKTLPYILHHHHKITESKYLSYCNYDYVNRLIERFNKTLKDSSI